MAICSMGKQWLMFRCVITCFLAFLNRCHEACFEINKKKCLSVRLNLWKKYIFAISQNFSTDGDHYTDKRLGNFRLLRCIG